MSANTRRITNAIAASNGDEWTARCEYWRNYKPKSIGGAPKQFKHREPLILSGHGVRIRAEYGTLLIHNGFTHYPQEQEEIRLFPGDANLPDRIIVLDGSGGISFAALTWLAEQQISLVQLDWRGNVSFVGGNSGYSGNKRLIDQQLAIKGTRKATQIARYLITNKIAASIDTLAHAIPKSDNREIAISRLYNWISELRNSNKSISLPKILGIEGGAAAAYFLGWQGIRINWRSQQKRAIPNGWHEMGPRTMTWRRGHQNARHPINAMLNYGYGMLVSQVRTHVVAAGLDPGIGIMHGAATNRIPLVYDLMEPLRPLVDRKMLEFAMAHTFSPGDFAINRHGGCRLNPQMARTVSRQVCKLNVDEVVKDFETDL